MNQFCVRWQLEKQDKEIKVKYCLVTPLLQSHHCELEILKKIRGQLSKSHLMIIIFKYLRQLIMRAMKRRLGKRLLILSIGS